MRRTTLILEVESRDSDSLPILLWAHSLGPSSHPSCSKPYPSFPGLVGSHRVRTFLESVAISNLHPCVDNLVVNQLFGTVSGLGMGVVTFDWAQISWIGSPLMVPWWAQIHVMGGFVFFYWFLLPILYYTNVRTQLPSYLSRH
jgi:hypothetical protein